MIIDTHTHLYLEDFDSDREEVVKRAKDAGVGMMFLPNIDSGTLAGLFEMTDKYEGTCFAMGGLHPGSVKEDFRDELAKIRKFTEGKKIIAIGEIGIDLYWDKTFHREQEEAFIEQIRWAKETGLPMVIHARESFNEIFRILDNHLEPGMTGVFHSFTGGIEEVGKIREYDFYFGINGISTFKNSGLKEIVKSIPADRLLLETDSPFLAPVPKRGRRNESAFVRYLNDFLAEYLGKTPGEMELQTTENARRLFKV